MTKQLAQRPEDAEAGAFIGFDSSESDMSQDEVNIYGDGSWEISTRFSATVN